MFWYNESTEVCTPVRVRVKVSVVLCTYTMDMYEHFCEAADSILAQTHSDVELIVIVDGAQKLYERVLNEYEEYDNVVVECNSENLGLLISRNRGAALASGEVVAFIDDDAIADEMWLKRLIHAYENENAIAAGGKIAPEWTTDKPSFIPEEFYWLLGVTHRGFSDGAGEVRNTFGSNISFRAEIFDNLEGFDRNVGGRKGDVNLQGGETELCVRMKREYGQGVWYDPKAVVSHKIFQYRTNFTWLIDRAFWQGYSKRAMKSLNNKTGNNESVFLNRLMWQFVPNRVRDLGHSPGVQGIMQLGTLLILTAMVGAGYMYAAIRQVNSGETDR